MISRRPIGRGSRAAGRVGGAAPGGAGVAPPSSVNAGSDAGFDMLSASPCTLSGSATGATSYLWSKVSGPGAVTFADATAVSTTCICDADGAYVLRLTATNAGGSTSDDVTITVTATLSALLTRMAVGSRLNVWYEVGVSGETLNSGNFSQLNDVGSAGLHLVQATAGNQPSKDTGNGPAGKDCITFQGTGRRLTKTSFGVAAGKALFIGSVVKGVAVAAARSQSFTRETNESTGDSVWLALDTAANIYQSTGKCNGGIEESVAHTSPAHSTNWYFKTIRYAASILPEVKINNATVSPTFVTATGVAAAVGAVVLGHTSVAAGSTYCWFAFEAVTTAPGTACLSEEGAIRYYVNKQTGL